MIIFHEGLPGSGKSYEAMVSRIVPALAKGREVVAYVEGLDFDKIAELAGIEAGRCRELLTAVTREQVAADWLSVMRPNALHVLDEAQNFWGNRRKFTDAETKMVTEHRHEGMDIVLMGQDLRDVHATWRRRVELKLCFLKLNGFGKLFAKRYSCTSYRHLGGDEFKRVGLSIRAYDPRYFGTYKSHVSDDTNTEDYSEDRAQVLGHPLMKYGMPAAVVAGIWGMWSAWQYFHPVQTEKAPQVAAQVASQPVGRPAPSLGAASAVPAPKEPDKRSPIERRMADLGATGRIRLAGLISSKDRTSGIVEWVQAGNVVLERLSLDALRSLGVAVIVTDDAVVQLVVGGYRELATPWPLEEMARVSDARAQAVRGPQGLSTATPMPSDVVTAAAPPSFVDRPGTLKSDEDAGSMQRRVARVAR